MKHIIMSDAFSLLDEFQTESDLIIYTDSPVGYIDDDEQSMDEDGISYDESISEDEHNIQSQNRDISVKNFIREKSHIQQNEDESIGSSTEDNTIDIPLQQLIHQASQLSSDATQTVTTVLSAPVAQDAEPARWQVKFEMDI